MTCRLSTGSVGELHRSTWLCLNDSTNAHSLCCFKVHLLHVYCSPRPSESPPPSLTQRVTSLQHKALDNPMEDDVVIVTVLGVRGEVLNSARTLLREQLESDVTL